MCVRVSVCVWECGGGRRGRNALNQEKQNTNLAAHSPGRKSQMFASEKQLECTEKPGGEAVSRRADRGIVYTHRLSPPIDL